MLRLGSVYLIVKDMERSLEFYEALLDMEVTSQNFNRWAQFDFGNASIALYNPLFDEDRVSRGDDLESAYNSEYLEYRADHPVTYGNNVVLNFWVPDLNEEYERVKALGIGEVSEILFINVASPYYFFMLEDPDGNQLEITGTWNPSGA
ncbi:MAG: VOC family protein [Anaerolineales bacterium]